jgi:aryl-alcohol dehydrogenase-like predicted oxidoreductase
MVKEIILGAMMFGWKVSLLDAIRIADYAVENGVKILDTSPSYGAGLSELICAQLLRRHEGLKISTKFSIMDDSLKSDIELNIESLCYQRLSLLGKERIDYFVLHRDNNIDDIEALCKVILKLKVKGVIDRFFISNSTVDTYLKILKFEENNSTAILDGLQLKKNLLFEDVLFEIAPHKSSEIVFTYSPLCEGVLTGKYLHRTSPPPFSRISEVTKNQAYYLGLISSELNEKVTCLENIAMVQGLSLLEYSYKYVLSFKKVSGMIVGPSSLAQFVDAISCADRFSE